MLESKELIEYKIFCFNGIPKIILVCKGQAHSNIRTNDYFDINFNHIPVSVTYPNSKEQIYRPNELEEMLWISMKLSVGIPFLRVDMYIADHKIYVGEMTFFHEGGHCHFMPKDYDYEFGKLLTLPQKIY